MRELVPMAAAAVAIAATFLLLRPLARHLFAGSTARAAEWVVPREPTRMDVFMSALGEEVRPWRGGRVVLLCLLGVLCCFMSFKAAEWTLTCLVSLTVS